MRLTDDASKTGTAGGRTPDAQKAKGPEGRAANSDRGPSRDRGRAPDVRGGKPQQQQRAPQANNAMANAFAKLKK
jgi:hypothetical protein